jgi:hypothetical protein
MNRVRDTLILFAITLILYPAERASLSVQDSAPCEAMLLERARNDTSGYKPRDGTRCEGFYDRQVSTSTPLTLRSFMVSPPLTGALPSPIRVSWRLSRDRQIDLRASALKRRVYFQMDARAGSSDRVYEWPTNVLREAALGPADIGLTVSYTESGQRVYVPASFDNTGSGNNAGTYRIALWPEQGFKEVYISVTGRSTSGTVLARRELRRGPYPATRPIQFSIPSPSSPGLYELTVSASFETSDGAYSLTIPFEVPGR